MAVSVGQDEDLIIINSESEDDIFNFGEKSNTEVKNEVASESSSEGIIDFLSDDGVTSTIEAPSSISQPEVEAESITFSNDLLEVEASSEVETPVVEAKKEDEDLSSFEFSFDLDSSVSENNTESSDTLGTVSASNEVLLADNSSQEDSFSFDSAGATQSETEEVGDINTILDQTIGKLNSRKEVISSQKDDKNSKVESLLAQIKSLEETVANYREEIESLESEFKKIDKNISAIEKMKSDSLEAVTERPRQHNLNNIKKTK